MTTKTSTRSVAAAPLLLLALLTRSEGADGAKACIRTCTTAHGECRAAAKALRASLLGACTPAAGDRRSCRAAARGSAGAMGSACKALRRDCRQCCKTGGSSCEQPRVTQDAGRTASALLTPDGGTLTATGADGTTYVLEVPADALLDDTTITLTPVTAIGGFPVGGTGIRGAVQAEPSGLSFLTPATLTITLSVPPAQPGVAFGWRGSGSDLHSELETTAERTLRLPVAHFSGFGVGPESSPELRALLARAPSGAAEQLARSIFDLERRGVEDPDRYVSVIRQWYRTVLKPDLQAAVGSDGVLRRALNDYDDWLRLMTYAPDAVIAALAPEQVEAKTLIAAALRDAIARANARCLAQHSLAEAEAALEWQVIADAADVDTPGNALDLDTVLDGLCVEAVYDEVSYPADPPPGTLSELFIRTGLVFIDGVEATGDRMGVDITPHGTVELFAGPLPTNPDGSFPTAFTPAGDRELRLDIRSCADIPGRRRLKRVCQDAFVVRGMEVEPSQVTLAAGATQQFQAILFGQATAAIDWTATGGSIDASGTFTAGSSAGTFEVRATSTIDGRSATATVVIDTRAVFAGTVTERFHGVRPPDPALCPPTCRTRTVDRVETFDVVVSERPDGFFDVTGAATLQLSIQDDFTETVDDGVDRSCSGTELIEGSGTNVILFGDLRTGGSLRGAAAGTANVPECIGPPGVFPLDFDVKTDIDGEPELAAGEVVALVWSGSESRLEPITGVAGTVTVTGRLDRIN